jgi:hypothetical protein
VTTPERRKYVRYGFQSDAEVVHGGETKKAFITDISMGGLFIVTETPLRMGAACTVRVLLNPPITLNCVVRRVLFGKGMGVGFDPPAEEVRVRLERLIASLMNP